MKIGDEVIKIPAGQFLLDSGLLFEINRKVLHPFGLALEVIESPEPLEEAYREDNDPPPTYVISNQLWDYRDDEEGMIFAEKTFREGFMKLKKFMAEFGFERLNTRAKALGYVIQGEDQDFIQSKKMLVIDTIVGPAKVIHVDANADSEDKQEEAFVKSIPLAVDVPAGELPTKNLNADETSLSIIERNMVAKTKANMKKSNIKEKDYSHIGTDGQPCKNPVIVSEPLSGGGSIVMCSTCGATISDPDLKD